MIAAPAPAAWVEPATGMEFVRVPAGRYLMGTPAGEPGREAQETAFPPRPSGNSPAAPAP